MFRGPSKSMLTLFSQTVPNVTMCDVPFRSACPSVQSASVQRSTRGDRAQQTPALRGLASQAAAGPLAQAEVLAATGMVGAASCHVQVS